MTTQSRSEQDLAALGLVFLGRGCPSRPALEHITGRWGALILLSLQEGAQRFSALHRRVDGISEKMLARTLQAQERDGFVRRDAGDGFPSRVEYSLTELGYSTAALLRAVTDHLKAHLGDVLAAQTAYDDRHTS